MLKNAKKNKRKLQELKKYELWLKTVEIENFMKSEIIQQRKYILPYSVQLSYCSSFLLEEDGVY